MKEAVITVVIATYNRAALLSRAIRSVQSQTYRDVIIAVYDNASSDNTREVVERMQRDDPRIYYHRHPENIGAAANFRYGLQRIDTPLFFLLSDDDVALPKFFATAVSWFERYPEARFVAGGTLEMSDRGELLFAPQAYWPREGLFVPPDGLDLMLSGFHPSWNTMIFRTAILQEVGEFNSAIPNVSDLDFTLRIASRYPYIVFREPSGIFVRHAASGGEFSDTSIIAQYETMMAALLADEHIGEPAKALIHTRLLDQLSKRIIQISIKQLLKGEPQHTRQTLRVYHQRYPRTALSAAVTLAARACVMFPPLLRTLGPLERMRKFARTRMTFRAARRNGELLNVGEYAAYLN